MTANIETLAAKIETLKTKARAACAAQTLETLIRSYIEDGNHMDAARAAKDDTAVIYLAKTRGWIADELERRNPTAFDAWIDSPCNDKDLPKFFGVTL